MTHPGLPDTSSTPTASDRVVFAVPRDYAYAVRDALDLYVRTGLGQLDAVTELAKSGELKRKDGTTPSMDDIEDAEQAMAVVRQKLFGFAPSASHGVLSPYVREVFRKAWGVRKALTHRLAYDRNPAGSSRHGVAFDEPLFEQEKACTVSSATEESLLMQLPPELALARRRGQWVVFNIASRTVLAESANLQTAVQKAIFSHANPTSTAQV